MVKLVKLRHPENAFRPISTMLLGMVKSVMLHPENAFIPIEVTPSGMVTLVRLHPKNASSPIEVIPLGMTALVRPVQSLNAQAGISVVQPNS